MAHLGFKKLKGKIKKEGYSDASAGAITASIGRKKLGKAAFQKKAAAGRRRSGRKSKSY